jgi:four helix bundle protein
VGRDHRKLEVFELADGLVLEVYRATSNIPPAERYGLQTQIRRGALSVACNIVEGCARRSTKEYLHFINVAFASAAETHYLLSTAARLELLAVSDGESLCNDYNLLLSKLPKLLQAIERMVAETPHSNA